MEAKDRFRHLADNKRPRHVGKAGGGARARFRPHRALHSPLQTIAPPPQRLGDLAAGTIVVRTNEAPLPQLPPGAATRTNSLKPYRTLTARLRQKVNPAAARVALEALKRRDQLDAESRLQLFAEIAADFRSLVEFPEEATLYLTDEQYLWNVVEILYAHR